MKRIFKLVLVVLVTLNCTFSTVQAQTPQKMTYQAVVRNASNNLVTNTAVGIEINILQGSATGTQVYTETQTPTTNNNGLLTIEIGGEVGFDTITWVNAPYFLETNIDPDNSGTYTITGVNQLLTVAYALHAKTAESITGTVNYTETDPVYLSSQAANITATDITNLSNLSGTNTGNQDISGIATNLQAIQDTASQIRADFPDVSGFITTETDPVYSAWNKSYNDLTNTPNITDTVTAVLDTTTQFIRTENQNLSDILALNNDGNAKQIKNIADPTDAQDVVTKAYVDALELRIDLLEGKKIQDIDGNTYSVIIIGTQVWMAEDLKVTHYPNGDTIPNVTDNTAWGNLADDNTSDAYCYYNNNTGGEANTYGALYTYAAAIGDNWARDNTANQGVCPDGWHLPTDAEWTILTDYLGGTSVAGGKMKEIIHWNSPNTGADNSSGFSALPSGIRSNNGDFGYLGNVGNWWSATEFNSNNTYHRYLYYISTEVFRLNSNKSRGYSVRCVRD